MPKLFATKGSPVVRALVNVSDAVNGGFGSVNQGGIALYINGRYEGEQKVVLQLRFQRNVLDALDPIDRTVQPLSRLSYEKPHVSMDFGERPFGHFYAPHVDMDHDFSTDSRGIAAMETAIRLIKKLNAAVDIFKLHTVPDELMRYVEALKRLDVKIDMNYYVGNCQYHFIDDMPERFRKTGSRYIESRQAEAVVLPVSIAAAE